MPKLNFKTFASFVKSVFFVNLVAAVLTLICIHSAEAQMVRNTEYQADQSLKSNARVNPSTRAMELSIPLAGYKGRAGNGLPVTFNYSSKVWQIKATGAFENQHGIITDTRPMYGLKTAGWTSNLASPLIDFYPARYEGFRPNYQYEGMAYETSPVTDTLSDPLYYVKRVHVIMPGGGSHEFRADDTKRNCGTMQYMCDPDLTGTYLSVDGTRMRLEITGQSKVLFMPDGSRYLFGQNGLIATTMIDPHGNQMTYDIANRRWTDTLGRVINDPINPNWGDSQQNQTVGDQPVSLPGIGTGNVNVTLSWRYLKDPNNPNGSGASGLENISDTLHSLSNTGCHGNGNFSVTGPYLFTSPEMNLARVCQPGTSSELDWTQGPPFNPIVLTKITLANGQFYEFKYNVYGEITKIIYPTGGYERFVYEHIPTLQGNEDTYSQANRGVKERWVSVKGDGTDEEKWTYQVGTPYKVITTAPDLSRTEQYLYTEPIVPPVAYGFIREQTGRSYEDRVYSTANQLMRRNLTKYVPTGAQSGGYTGATRDLRVEKQVSIIFEPGSANALAQLVETVYETPGMYGAPTDPAYFAAQNAKQSKVYHYVSISAATAANDATDIDDALAWFTGSSPATTTETDYLYDGNYLARNITGLATETRIKDASGAVKAKTQISYDESGYSLSSIGSMPTAAANSWVDLTHTDQLGPTVGSKRGLPTTVKSYTDIATSQYVTTHSFYDQYGNLRKMRDGRGNDTETEYSASFAFAYPTLVKTPIPDTNGTHGSNAPLITTSDYDYNTGLPLWVKDANGQTSTLTTQMEYNDLLLRPTKVIAPNGHQTITEYGAGTSDSTRYIKVRTQIDETRWKEGYTFFDGIGRTVKTQSVESDGDVFTETEYDDFGRVWKTSNPYRVNETIIWTENFYDTASRLWKVKTADNSEVETFYSLATTGNQLGTVVTVEDQANKQRRSITNALGQLTRVDEPTTAGLGAINAPTQPTLYSYDVLNNLVQVVQNGSGTDQCGTNISCSQTRTFTYDALSRLKSAANPESGTITYSYDNNGNLISKTDAKPVTTTYSYDALNRVKTRSYSDSATKPVSYFYDNLTNAKGKLIKVVTDTTGTPFSVTEYQAFDTMGRVTQSQQTTDGVTYPVMTYGYNLSGALIEQKYPSGRVVKSELDADGSLSVVKSKKSANAGYWNYAQHFTYTAAGAVKSMQLGNGTWESTQFNNRLQPTQIALGSVQNGFDKLKLNFDYGTTANNGNVLSQTITVPTVGSDTGFTAVQSYTYDQLNRIQDVNEKINGSSTPEWKQTFKYDRYGNRRFNTDNNNTTTFESSCATAICNPEVSPTKNRLVGYTFDNAGNTTIDASGKTFTYDGENKQVKVESGGSTIGEYWYDGDGKRVKKIGLIGGIWEETIFVYDASSRLVAEYSNVVEPTATATVSYLTNDHLGSPRITTDKDGKVISRRDFMPFGEEISTSQRTARTDYAGDNVRKKFTGYERDDETELDFAQARMYAHRLGRFTTVDPIALSAERMQNPQQINLYIYTGNNPLNYIDPSGEDTEDIVEDQVTTYSFTIEKRGTYTQKVGKGKTVKKEWVFQVKVTVTETRRVRKNDSGEIKQISGLTKVTVNAENTEAATNLLTESQLSTVETVTAVIVEEASKKMVDVADALAIGVRETFLGADARNAKLDHQRSEINPLQLTTSSGKKPTSDLRTNVRMSLDHYVEMSRGQTKINGFQRYGPRSGNPGGAGYGTAVEGISNGIKNGINGSIRIGYFHRRYAF